MTLTRAQRLAAGEPVEDATADDVDAARELVYQEHRNSGWAVEPETLAMIAAWNRGEISHAQVTARAGRMRASAGDPEVTGGVAVLSLSGLLTPRPSLLSLLFGFGGGLQEFRSQLREALASEAVASILIDVDSPGGTTDLMPETAAEIRNARGVKPIVAIANCRAASGAYWLASQADELVVTPSGEAGSIGVFATHVDISAAQEQMGVKTTIVRAGRFKAEGNPYEPLSEEAKAALQAKVDEYYGLFVADVAAGRGVPDAKVRGGFGEGRMLTAQNAVDEGMADRVATFEATVSELVRSGGDPTRRPAAIQPGGAPSAEDRRALLDVLLG